MNTIYQRLSEQLLTVHCGQCNGDAKHKVMTILADKKVACPTCATSIEVDTATLERKIEAAQARRNAQRPTRVATAAGLVEREGLDSHAYAIECYGIFEQKAKQ